MNFARFDHFLEFSKKNKKGKLFYTEHQLATGLGAWGQVADWMLAEIDVDDLAPVDTDNGTICQRYSESNE
jgi:hypothetical protein